MLFQTCPVSCGHGLIVPLLVHWLLTRTLCIVTRVSQREPDYHFLPDWRFAETANQNYYPYCYTLYWDIVFTQWLWVPRPTSKQKAIGSWWEAREKIGPLVEKVNWPLSGAGNPEWATPTLRLCHGVFTDQFIFRHILGHFFPRK